MHHLTTPVLGLSGSLRWSGSLHSCECSPLAGSARCESSGMREENSSCQDTACLFGIRSACKMRGLLHWQNYKVLGEGRDAHVQKGKGAWYESMEEYTLKYFMVGCSRLHTSAEGVSRLPEEDAGRVNRPEFSPAVSQMGCSQGDFWGCTNTVKS